MKSDSWILIGSAVAPWFFILISSWLAPRLTRPDLFFSVTVKPDFRSTPEGAGILRDYTQTIMLFAGFGLLPLAFLSRPEARILPGILGPAAIELIGFFVAFVVSRRRVMPFRAVPTSIREVGLAPRKPTLPGGWFGQAWPFLILGGVCVAIGMKWDQIPNRVPIHWGAAGRPDGWAAKSWASIFGLPILGMWVCGFMCAISFAVSRGARRVHSSGQAGLGEGKFVRTILFFLLAMNYWIAVLMGTIGAAVLRPNLSASIPQFWLILPAEFAIVGVILAIGYRMGQGGWRVHDATTAQDGLPVGDRTPDECWKLGMLYYNPDDPAVLVEKRFGIGWTLNFACPKSWLLISLFLVFMAGVLVVSLVATHQGAPIKH